MVGNICLIIYKVLIALLVFFICFLIIGPGFRVHVAAPFICAAPASFIFYSLNVKRNPCPNVNTPHAGTIADAKRKSRKFIS